MDILREFLKKNEVRIGKDYTSNTPLYYSSIDNALHHYFLTIRDVKGRYQILDTILEYPRKTIAFDTNEATSNIANTILSFHRFFELFLKDILSEIDPQLAFKFPQKVEDIYTYLKGKDVEGLQLVDFKDALDRVKGSFKYLDKKSKEYELLTTKYSYLNNKEVQNSISIISELRNRVMHNGKILPNIFALDFLISQKIIPIISMVIKSNELYSEIRPMHYLITRTGINIIDEISEIKFKINDFNNPNKKHLYNSLYKLGHLKELGRASYNDEYYMRKSDRKFHEIAYESPNTRSERFAAVEVKENNKFKLKKCICCGVKSVVVYQMEIPKISGVSMEIIKWLKCFNCDYSLDHNLGEPKDFNLHNEYLFD